MRFPRHLRAVWIAPRSALEKGVFGGIAAAGVYLSAWRMLTDTWVYLFPALLFLHVAIAAAYAPTEGKGDG